MPQMNKGGKFIFGISVVQAGGAVRFPDQAVWEYDITAEGRVILSTGSRVTGGFIVTRKGLLEGSKLERILEGLPALRGYEVPEGEFLSYKGRQYCWTEIDERGTVRLTENMMEVLDVSPGMGLLSIRSSSLAFTMGARGPLLEKADRYKGEIPVF